VHPGGAVWTTASAGVQLEGFVGPARSDTDLAMTFELDRVPVGGAVYLTSLVRRVDRQTGYSAKVLVNPGGSVTIRLARKVGGTETVIAGPITVAGLTYTAGTDLTLRVQATGTSPSTVRARVWRAGQNEPTGWQVSATDNTAGLQVGGAVGLIDYLSSNATNPPVHLTLTSLTAKPTQ
jgi:hypothetical protein